MQLRRFVPSALVLALSIVPRTSAGSEVEVPVPLAPGPLRLALPSPDGTRLVVAGGPGVQGREHTVIVLDLGCGRDSVRTVTLSRSAPYDTVPAGVPEDFVRLQWSPDGRRVFALGGIYEITDAGGALSAKLLRRTPKPLLDFRFGPGGGAAGVAMRYAEEKQITRSRRGFVVGLEYAMYPLDRELVIPIPPREKYGAAWITREWPDPPALEFEGDGKLLIFYPYHKITERYAPGKVRKEVKNERPTPRPEPGLGPFTFKKPCRRAWTLIADGKSDRVRVRFE
jgi:hypothetical protein